MCLALVRHSDGDKWLLNSQVAQNALKHAFDISLLVLCIELRTYPGEEPKLRVGHLVLFDSLIIFEGTNLQSRIPCQVLRRGLARKNKKPNFAKYESKCFYVRVVMLWILFYHIYPVNCATPYLETEVLDLLY